MLNIKDFTLMPLDALVYDEALRSQFLDMMDILYVRYSMGLDGEVAPDLFRRYSADRMRSEFEKYVASSKEWSSSSGWPVRDAAFFVLVGLKSNQILGYAQFIKRWIANTGDSEEKYYFDGYDIIHPDLRLRGYAKVILALRMYKAKELGAAYLQVVVGYNTDGSQKRLDKLVKDGIAVKAESQNYIGATIYRLPAIDDPHMPFDVMTRPLFRKVEQCCSFKAPEANL